MSANTKIQWTDHTFNPWMGCTKISPGCAHCYAEARDKRHLIEPVDHWGKGIPRLRTSAANWKLPMKWNKSAGKSRVFDGEVFEEGGSTETVGKPSSFRIVGYSVTPGMRVHFTREDWESAPRPRPRVFCASLADWLDDEVPIEWLADLLQVIHATPNLDWQLLTKRPGNWSDRISAAMGHLDSKTRRPTAEEEDSILAQVGKVSVERFESIVAPFKRSDVALWLGRWLGGKAPENIWLGTTCEDQTRADQRIPELLQTPARVRFLSVEPMLEAVDLSDCGCGGAFRIPSCKETGPCGQGVDWIIVGGESGTGARECNIDHIIELVWQCQDAGVPVFVKQLGALPSTRNSTLYHWPAGTKFEGTQGDAKEWLCLKDKKGGDLAEFPTALQFRQFPRPCQSVSIRG